MKRLLPLCLLAAIFSASADTSFPVNVSNNGIIDGTSNSVTITVDKPSSDSGNNEYYALRIKFKNNTGSPIHLLVYPTNKSIYNSEEGTWAELVAIEGDSEELFYYFEESNKISIEIKNIYPTDKATVEYAILSTSNNSE